MSRFFFLAQINKDFYDEVMRLEDSLPKKKFYLPKGVFKTVVMIFAMALGGLIIFGLMVLVLSGVDLAGWIH
jgi:hypothetical protein